VGDKLFEFAFIMANELGGNKKVANDMAKWQTGSSNRSTSSKTTINPYLVTAQTLAHHNQIKIVVTL